MRLKKVKGAYEKVINSAYYVDNPEQYKGKWNSIFKNGNPINIEIGMGKGQFIIGMAQKYPEKNFIGIEMYDSVLLRAVQNLDNYENQFKNLKLLLVDANKIDTIFENEIDTIYLNFSDPWPKAKHAKRRLTSDIFLDKYEKVFKNKKIIAQKTDNLDLFNYSIETLTNHGYELIEVTNDLNSLNDESNILTEYEAKFVEKGIKINRLKAIK